MSTNNLFSQILFFTIAQKNAKKKGVSLPKEAYLGLMPGSGSLISNYLLTDVATKKAIKEKERNNANSLLNELANKKVTELDAVPVAVPANIPLDPLVISVKAYSPKLRTMIANRVRVPLIKDELLK